MIQKLLLKGHVMLGIHHRSGRKVAIKIVDREKLNESVLMKVSFQNSFLYRSTNLTKYVLSRLEKYESVLETILKLKSGFDNSNFH